MADMPVDTGAGEVSGGIDYNQLPDDKNYIPPEQQDNSLASPFLKNIQDDNERKIVEKYVRDWDAGVTKKIESVHNQYRWVKDLGDVDPEQVRVAMSIMNTLDTNPKAVYDILHEQYGQQVAQQAMQGKQGVPELDEDDPYSTMHPVIAQEFKQMRDLLQLMAGQQVQQTQAQTAYREDQMLDEHLSSLHQTHGDFDEDFVLTKVLAGKTWDQALQEHDAMMQRLTGTVRRAPAVLGGGGIPANKVPPSKLSGDDLNKFVASQLAALHQSD